MKRVSLTNALKGRDDVPNLMTASRWIKRGWIGCSQKAEGNEEYEVGSETLFQIRVLYKLSHYFNSEVLAQVGHILQSRSPEFLGWLGVLSNGKVINIPWDTQPGVVIDNLQVEAVINLNRMESKIPNLLVKKVEKVGGEKI